MSKPTGGPRTPGKKPFRAGGKPGKPGAYSQRLIKKATAGVRPPRPGKRDSDGEGASRSERDTRPASGARFNGSKRSLAGAGGRRDDDRARPDSGKRFEGSQRSFTSGARSAEGDGKPKRFKRVRLDRNAPPERNKDERPRPHRGRNDQTRRGGRTQTAQDRPSGPSHPNDARGSNRDRAATRDRTEARVREREDAREQDRERTAHRTYGDTRQREQARRDRAAGRTPAPMPAPAAATPPTRTPGSEPRPEKPRFQARLPREQAPGAPTKTAFRVKPVPGKQAPATRPPAPSRAAAAASGPAEPMRIAKAMARSGLCSRRDAERWIADGRVAINGRILTTPAVEVGPTDKILVDGQPLPAAEPAQIWRYYKPRGLVTTHADPEGRPTVFDALPPEMPRVVSIGRLDFNTEGLLLLTNDGELARHLELPATGWLRRYRVRAYGRVTQEELNTLKDGITIEGVRYGGIEATLDSVQAGNMWLTIGLREGKNREVRRILGSLALEVNRLIRISYGPFQLTDLTPGMVEPIKRRVLADQLGPDAAQFGLTGAIDGYKARQGKAAGRKPQDDDE